MSGLTRAKDGKVKVELDDDIHASTTGELDMAHRYIRQKVREWLPIAKTRVPALINPEDPNIPAHLDGMLPVAQAMDPNFKSVKEVCNVLGGPSPPPTLVNAIAQWVEKHVSDDQLHEYGVDMTLRYMFEEDKATPLYIRTFAKERPTVFQILASWKLYTPEKWQYLRTTLREFERGLIDDKTFIMRTAQFFMRK